eukprot:TRINITY_DN24520_c0_g1_i1.p2 TRINITY_DN24520_c0_g1~~TRINITY_DN24520_c0_g1_i1.p2  ORF type:complete len:212 (+),score=67.06 TRINITY_DN24520_c0_g1_i1:61-696(+)
MASERERQPVDEALTVVVSSLRPQATAADVSAHFSYCGEITRLSFIPDPRQPGSRAAVVSFSAAEARDLALLLHHSDLCGVPCDVAPVEVVLPPLTAQELAQSALGMLTESTGDAQVSRSAGSRTAPAAARSERNRGAPAPVQMALDKVRTLPPSSQVAACGAALLAAGGFLFAANRRERKIASQQRRGRELVRRELRALTLDSRLDRPTR